MRALVALLLALAVLSPTAGCGGDEAERPFTLALDFTPNAAHAGIYSAPEGSGLRVRAPGNSTDSLKLLESRRADMAVLDIADLGLAREKGADVVAVAALVQRPLAAVIAGPGIDRPRELEGRRVGVTGLPSDEAVLRAVLEADGARLERVRRVTVGFGAVPSLVAGKVDAVTAFWNAEGVALREAGERTREFRLDDFGAPAYPELVLVVRTETLREDRTRVREILEALRSGTEAALRDPEGAVTAIARASGAEPSLVRAELSAVAPALRPALRLDRAAVEGWARFAERYGVLRERPAVDAAFAFDLVTGRSP